MKSRNKIGYLLVIFARSDALTACWRPALRRKTLSFPNLSTKNDGLAAESEDSKRLCCPRRLSKRKLSGL
jgi:hypothetical protein